MLERFTARARRSIVLASEEARSRGHESAHCGKVAEAADGRMVCAAAMVAKAITARKITSRTINIANNTTKRIRITPISLPSDSNGRPSAYSSRSSHPAKRSPAKWTLRYGTILLPKKFEATR